MNRAVTLLVPLLLASWAGCAESPQEAAPASQPAQPTSAQQAGPGLTGRVLSLDYVPIANATVRLHKAEQATATDGSGRYELAPLPPGEHVFAASAAGYVTATQRIRIGSDGLSTLDFALEEAPRGAPYNQTQPGDGFIACMAAFGNHPENPNRLDCGEFDANDNRFLSFPIGPGARHIVIDADWEATTEASHFLALRAGADEGAAQPVSFGQVTGPAGIKLVVQEEVTRRYFENGGTLVTEMVAAPSILGDEAGYDAGVAIQQPFTVYVTVFYHGRAPVDFTAAPPREHSHCPLPSCE